MNKTNVDLSGIDTVILAGGLGIRLQSVLKDKPKCLALINGRPFIDILLDDCINQGLRRFILCVGYLKEQVIEYLSNRDDCEIIYSEEEDLLGTGGAVKNANHIIYSDNFIVMNGDTFIDIDYKDWYNNLTDLESIAICNKRLNNKSYGTVVLDKYGKIISFIEKSNNLKTNCFVNTGRYILSKQTLNEIPTGKNYSIEYQLFPKLIKNRIIGSYCVNKDLIDIGTPERYNKAQELLK